MASAFGRLSRLSAFKNIDFLKSSHRLPTTRAQCRTAVFNQSGGILPKPKKAILGLSRITLVVVPFCYVGTQISKNFAALLEEHEIFIPEDDDDDD